MDILVAIIQTAAIGFLGWGAYLCVFCSERRASRRRELTVPRRRDDAAPAKVVNLREVAAGRRTDFSIGFHDSRKRAA